MKALSMGADYALMILSGDKTIEYRSWSTTYRGPLLICASQKKIEGTMPGYANCVIDLVDIKKTGPREYEWMLGDFHAIEPFPVKGRLHLFDVPDDKIIFHPEVDDKSQPSEKVWYDYQRKYLEPHIYWPTKK
ncbi:ASCH domain-containing protein [Lentilactobacillus otakiensis]|uniref:ASCH domain-containing protein n=1 Tax=Lentilactobacillus otakiensis TaxID=481720 RepID=UPI003D1702BB